MVTYALTMHQPWASLIIEGIKPYEFREWPTPDWVIGKRIVIHAAKRPMRPLEVRGFIARLYQGYDDGMDTGRALDLLEAVWRRDRELPLGAALGTAVLSPSIDCTVLFEVEDVDPDKQAWPLSKIRRWPTPLTIGGARRFWRWPHELEAGQ